MRNLNEHQLSGMLRRLSQGWAMHTEAFKRALNAAFCPKMLLSSMHGQDRKQYEESDWCTCNYHNSHTGDMTKDQHM